MKLTLNITYRTNWGESLYLSGSPSVMGANDTSRAIRMSLNGDDRWSLDIDIPDDCSEFTYSYIVRNDNGTERREWGAPRRFVRGNATPRSIVYDRWQDQPMDKPYYSSAFTDCINHRAHRMGEAVARPDTITLKVSAPMVPSNCVLAVSGASTGLGEWDPKRAVRMTDADFPTWQAIVDARALGADTQYKFIIIDSTTGDVMAWEGGNNRTTGIVPVEGTATYVTGMRFISAEKPFRAAGVAIPVFSIRTDEDFGVGDFIDIKKMVDWAAMTGQKFIQLLPINDTTMTHTWTDSYPYNANSTFALHPMYIRLEYLGKLNDAKRRKHYDTLRRELNALDKVDYERVNDAKTEYIAEIFDQQGAEVLKSGDFARFMKANESWLRPYAVFCALRDVYGTPDFTKWGEYAEYTPDKIDKFIKASAKNRRAVDLVYYVQYNLDKQMREVRDYAHSKGIAIKGDIPIGISRTSVDAWTDTRLFYMDCQAGAPPDDFSVLGQNWGFPTYNWEEMNKDGFAWWKARFRKMSEYFDAYRIDHVLGFFRIWQIPMDAVHGLLGTFNPALPFTPDELRNSYDFWFDGDLYTKPYIMDYFLGDFFGQYTDEARKSFLESVGYGRYSLRKEFSTQRKVVDYFATQPKNEKNNKLCNALLGLIDDVLFIEDPYEKGKYHPRISAQFTYIYRSLNDYERWCFDRLYNDFYYHRHNEFWYGKAMWKLPPLIDATNMLVCAEDLGMIPDCVPAVMHNLEILSLEIQRMPKNPKHEFGDTWSYPYFSVCTTSTHDMGGIRSWWEENREKTQSYFNNILGESGTAPYFAEPWVCAKILEYHFRSPSMLCIIPLADLLSMDEKLRRNDPREETINVPANPRHYWRYRMHLTVDELMAATAFNNQLSIMLAQAGR